MFMKPLEKYRIKVGDVVTRDGTDEHEVLEIDYDWGTMKVKCIKEPAIWSGGSEPWTKLGEIEENIIERYTLVMKNITKGEKHDTILSTNIDK